MKANANMIEKADKRNADLIRLYEDLRLADARLAAGDDPYGTTRGYIECLERRICAVRFGKGA